MRYVFYAFVRKGDYYEFVDERTFSMRVDGPEALVQQQLDSEAYSRFHEQYPIVRKARFVVRELDER